MWTDRTSALIGEEGLEKLKNSHVAVVGIGGVGGYVCVMLARAGVGKLTIVDFDKVDETNINRQIVATTKTVGEYKVDVMAKMLRDINSNCQVCALKERFNENFAKTLFQNHFDFVVDAIDSVSDKVELICFCKQNGIDIVSAMGAGNRIDIPHFEVTDIFKTSNDGLAKVMRKKLREKQVENLDVVTTTSKALATNGKIGSISYYPAMCGCVLSGFVINKLLAK